VGIARVQKWDGLHLRDMFRHEIAKANPTVMYTVKCWSVDVRRADGVRLIAEVVN
jgi:hypothetical protein